MRSFLLLLYLLIEARVDGINVFLILAFCREPEAFAEALIVYNFAFTEEAYGVVDIWVIRHSQDVVIGNACLLFSGQVLSQITDDIALYLHRRSRPRCSGRKLWIDTSRMVDKIRLHPSCLNVIHGHSPRQLLNNCTNHFQMVEFFCTYMVIMIAQNLRRTGKVSSADEYPKLEAEIMKIRKIKSVRYIGETEDRGFIAVLEKAILVTLKKRGYLTEKQLENGIQFLKGDHR